MLFVGIDGKFLVFGDDICGLVCWSIFVVSDGEVICSIGCIYYFWIGGDCIYWKIVEFLKFDRKRNVLMDLGFYFILFLWSGMEETMY